MIFECFLYFPSDDYQVNHGKKRDIMEHKGFSCHEMVLLPSVRRNFIIFLEKNGRSCGSSFCKLLSLDLDYPLHSLHYCHFWKWLYLKIKECILILRMMLQNIGKNLLNSLLKINKVFFSYETAQRIIVIVVMEKFLTFVVEENFSMSNSLNGQIIVHKENSVLIKDYFSFSWFF